MRIDLDFEIPSLGKTKTQSLGQASEILLSSLFSSNPKALTSLKAYEICSKLSDNPILDLNKEDLSNLKSFLENESTLFAGFKAPILNVIIDALNKKPEEKPEENANS